MLVEFNSYSLDNKVITFYCSVVENSFNQNRAQLQEIEFAFDTTNKYNTKYLIGWLKKQKAVKALGNESTWADVLSAVLGTVVNVNWYRYRVYA
ncbi:hypothetical protein MT487_00425 [Lachnospiraceae bacterium NSJ-171]|uniref:hypothetical protein n=1 Tax=Eubacterium sp. AF17-7 TaxID=2293105 RepID=UPI000E49CE42|nr:hypothetical protein [Eubacterium sp. AF17-7]MCJ7965538.1 hypothetical protein [Lachnospiraceae bacterium NSJ-171]RGG64354.1 hypothetical protein DWW96_09600 [Eubacterium sp. AF17-7]